jgi:soluble lytic murein transglycosylase-like protein
MTAVAVAGFGVMIGVAVRGGAPPSAAPVCPGAPQGGAPGPTVPVASTATAPAGSLPPALLARPARLQLLPVFRRWSSACDVSPALVEATCWWESGWQAGAVSDTGAVGVCQIEPSAAQTVRRLLDDPTLDPRSPSDNIEMSAAFLRWLLNNLGGRQDLALAGYYQGLSSVERSGILAGSRRYVTGITALLHEYSW